MGIALEVADIDTANATCWCAGVLSLDTAGQVLINPLPA